MATPLEYSKDKPPRVTEHGQRIYYDIVGRGNIASVHKALCQDGQYRIANAIGYPSTSYQIPARITVKGKTVAGYICLRQGVYTFEVKEGGANAQVVPYVPHVVFEKNDLTEIITLKENNNPGDFFKVNDNFDSWEFTEND